MVTACGGSTGARRGCRAADHGDRADPGGPLAVGGGSEVRDGPSGAPRLGAPLRCRGPGWSFEPPFTGGRGAAEACRISRRPRHCSSDNNCPWPCSSLMRRYSGCMLRRQVWRLGGQNSLEARHRHDAVPATSLQAGQGGGHVVKRIVPEGTVRGSAPHTGPVLDLGQCRAGGRLPGRDGIGLDRRRAAGAGGFPARPGAHQGQGPADLAPRRDRLARRPAGAGAHPADAAAGADGIRGGTAGAAWWRGAAGRGLGAAAGFLPRQPADARRAAAPGDAGRHPRARAAAALAERLRGGEAAFGDDEEQGRSRSLGASLSYGFSQGFDEAERRRLALLHLVQGIAWDAMLAHMEHQLLASDRPAPEAWQALLSRAADSGLLT